MDAIKVRESLMASWIEYLSFSSMKELRNNEAMFLKKYINYEFDNNVFVATIIWKSCHHGIEAMFRDESNAMLMADEPQVCIDKIIKVAKDYAKEEYIAKFRKPENFWNSKTMIEFGGYVDLVKLVDDYKKEAEKIKDLTVVEEIQKAEKDLEKVGDKIKKAIEKHKEKDAKLDDFIQWGVTGSIDKIMDGIQIGLSNWFTFVYPKVKNWKLIWVEFEKTLDCADLNGEILDLPLKVIIDAVFEDENWDLIIVDWKFKGTLSDDDSIKPDYDMQGVTYFFGGWTILWKKPKKALFIEIQPSDAKCTVTLQADLRKLCDENAIDWAKWNGGKYMTNAMMQDVLIEKGAIELKPVVYEYVIDFEAKSYLLEMWLVFYKQTIKRLYQLLVVWDDFILNIFDQSFDGWIKVYKEWMAQFMPNKEEIDINDAVDL